MRMLSEFIEHLEELKKEHGDLPVVTADPFGSQDTIPDDDSVCNFWEKGAWDSESQKMCNCILIR